MTTFDLYLRASLSLCQYFRKARSVTVFFGQAVYVTRVRDSCMGHPCFSQEDLSLYTETSDRSTYLVSFVKYSLFFCQVTETRPNPLDSTQKAAVPLQRDTPCHRSSPAAPCRAFRTQDCLSEMESDRIVKKGARKRELECQADTMVAF